MSRLILGLVVTVLLSLAMPIAEAQEAGTAEKGQHCVSRLVPRGPTRHGVLRTRARLLGCYSSFAEALRVGSGGAITIPEWISPATLTDRILEASTSGHPRGGALVGTEYTGSNFGGISQNYLGSSTCQGEIIEATNLQGADNDAYESGKGFGGCDHNKKFAGPWLGGDVITCTPNCSDYGPLANDVSSLRWRP